MTTTFFPTFLILGDNKNYTSGAQVVYNDKTRVQSFMFLKIPDPKEFIP